MCSVLLPFAGRFEFPSSERPQMASMRRLIGSSSFFLADRSWWCFRYHCYGRCQCDPSTLSGCSRHRTIGIQLTARAAGTCMGLVRSCRYIPGGRWGRRLRKTRRCYTRLASTCCRRSAEAAQMAQMVELCYTPSLCPAGHASSQTNRRAVERSVTARK